MKNLFSKKESEKGAVTIEATIALTTFLFAFLIIFSIITVCRAQARMQIAINSTAKEISQYSYLYGLSGMDETLAKFQKQGQEEKDRVNNLAGNVVGIFDAIQSLGEEAESVDIGDVNSVMDTWENIKTTAGEANANAQEVSKSIQEMASNPQQFLLGMAKLAGSEGLELAKSRAIAEPVSRALIQKHLKRSENDNAENYCRSVGIVPGTYFGQSSYFNGLDFSNSTLFPYGSDEITIVVTYKVKLLQLLPIDVEYTITQTARTKGWLHGDGTENGKTATEKIKAIEANGNTIWSNATVSERNSMIISEKVSSLKKNGYNGVSGETYIQAYDSANNKVVMVGSANPLYGLKSVDSIDKETLKEDIKRRVSQMESATNNRVYIEIKKKDDKGNFVTEKINCSEKELQKEIILVIPEDEGLKAYIEGVINEMGYSNLFTVESGYGTYLTDGTDGGAE